MGVRERGKEQRTHRTGSGKDVYTSIQRGGETSGLWHQRGLSEGMCIRHEVNSGNVMKVEVTKSAAGML